MGSWTPELLNLHSSPSIFFGDDNFLCPSFALLPLVLIQKLSSLRANHIPVIFNIFLTLVSRVWLSETASALITFCATGQSDEHSRQTVLNKIEQLHVDAQDSRLPGDASPQPPPLWLSSLQILPSHARKTPFKMIDNQKIALALSQPLELQTRVQQSARERNQTWERGKKTALRITGSYLNTLSYKNWFKVNGRIIKITEKSFRSSK